jgi:hypothetical protein
MLRRTTARKKSPVPEIAGYKKAGAGGTGWRVRDDDREGKTQNL